MKGLLSTVGILRGKSAEGSLTYSALPLLLRGHCPLDSNSRMRNPQTVKLHRPASVGSASTLLHSSLGSLLRQVSSGPVAPQLPPDLLLKQMCSWECSFIQCYHSPISEIRKLPNAQGTWYGQETQSIFYCLTEYLRLCS